MKKLVFLANVKELYLIFLITNKYYSNFLNFFKKSTKITYEELFFRGVISETVRASQYLSRFFNVIILYFTWKINEKESI